MAVDSRSPSFQQQQRHITGKMLPVFLTTHLLCILTLIMEWGGGVLILLSHVLCTGGLHIKSPFKMSWVTGLVVSKYLCLLEAPNEVNRIIAYIWGPWQKRSRPMCKVCWRNRVSLLFRKSWGWHYHRNKLFFFNFYIYILVCVRLKDSRSGNITWEDVQEKLTCKINIFPPVFFFFQNTDICLSSCNDYLINWLVKHFTGSSSSNVCIGWMLLKVFEFWSAPLTKQGVFNMSAVGLHLHFICQSRNYNLMNNENTHWLQPHSCHEAVIGATSKT